MIGKRILTLVALAVLAWPWASAQAGGRYYGRGYYGRPYYGPYYRPYYRPYRAHYWYR